VNFDPGTRPQWVDLFLETRVGTRSIMKWAYKNCDIEITTMLDPPGSDYFTPIVEVDCKTLGTHRMIATGNSFPTAELAEQHGMDVARKLIDKNFRDS